FRILTICDSLYRDFFMPFSICLIVGWRTLITHAPILGDGYIAFCFSLKILEFSLRQKAKGKRQKAKGRRQKAEGRRQNLAPNCLARDALPDRTQAGPVYIRPEVQQ
ncbi:hypothetical protein, partial [Marinobacter sp. BGYM27]|uniref:hypothetical protein n=1 Tax=Marinobacter sp. BGYM27 TaxID=2975597 RepID=UPI0021A69897